MEMEKEMICPYCEQGEVLAAKLIKKNKKIFVCDECDTVWLEKIDMQAGIRFDIFMESEGCRVSWDELEILN